MRALRSLLCSGFVMAALTAPAMADTVKVGLILPYSGVFARLGETMDNAVKLWVQQNGDTVGGTKIEIIRRDETGPNPDTAKRIAQELIARDQVQMLAGLVFTPNALAVAPLATEGKVPTVIMNAATAVITTKSPYFTRVSLTLPQTTEVFARWAATKGRMKRAYIAVSDYGPGYDAEESFKRSFTESGGSIVGSVRFPVMNPDFAPFLQRVLDEKPDMLYAFIPGGSQPPAFVKEFPRAWPGQGGHPPDAERRGDRRGGFAEPGRSRVGHHQRHPLYRGLSVTHEQGFRRGLEESLWRRQGSRSLRGRRL